MRPLFFFLGLVLCAGLGCRRDCDAVVDTAVRAVARLRSRPRQGMDPEAVKAALDAEFDQMDKVALCGFDVLSRLEHCMTHGSFLESRVALDMLARMVPLHLDRSVAEKRFLKVLGVLHRTCDPELERRVLVFLRRWYCQSRWSGFEESYFVFDQRFLPFLIPHLYSEAIFGGSYAGGKVYALVRCKDVALEMVQYILQRSFYRDVKAFAHLSPEEKTKERDEAVRRCIDFLKQSGAISDEVGTLILNDPRSYWI